VVEGLVGLDVRGNKVVDGDGGARMVNDGGSWSSGVGGLRL